METLEAAITTPIAILMMLASINLGLLVYGQQAVEAAARHGARMGSVAQQAPGAVASGAARSAIASARLVQNPSVTILSPGGAAGSLLRVRVSGEIPNFLGKLVPGLPNPFTCSGESVFRQEGWD
jgi:Flp pilus assembly protein TadG